MAFDLEKLQCALAYRFKDSALAEQALTHRSAGKQHNERLEFLGDSVLGFVIAQRLFETMPGASEGELSRMRANLVNKESLEAIAQKLELSESLLLGNGERISGGSQRASILADAVEALIGAIFQDGGMDACRKFILAQSESRLATVSSQPQRKDCKTELQELMQARALPRPSYTLVGTEGKEHEQVFTVSCEITGVAQQILGKGRSKRVAEQAAAADALALIAKSQASN